MNAAIIALSVPLLIVATIVGLRAVNRPRKIIIEGKQPASFPKDGFSHELIENLLTKFVTNDGRVEYERWHASGESRIELRSYLAAVRDFSPLNSPQRFLNRSEELRYWLYAYNACVIYSVLDNWPLSSVTDVKAPFEIVRGMGFFHQQQYSFGGNFMNLLNVERKQILNRYKDPRVHFVLNCASESCPAARPKLPTGDDLENLLSDAATDFINDEANVSICHKSRTIYLSRIFKWYKKDFLHEQLKRGEPQANGLIGYIRKNALGTLATELVQASDYQVKYHDYDWTLNSTTS